MQQRRLDTVRIHLQAGNNVGDSQRVHNIWFTRNTFLVRMRRIGKLIRFTQGIFIEIGQIFFDVGDQFRIRRFPIKFRVYGFHISSFPAPARYVAEFSSASFSWLGRQAYQVSFSYC